MKKPQNNNHTVDDVLANFTDQILAGTVEEDQVPFAPDPELRALQQTVLHLKDTLPEEGPSEAVIHRMRQNIVMQWKQQEEKTSASFWKRFLSSRKRSGQKWQSQDSRRRQTLSIYLITAVLLLLVSIPLLYKDISLQPAASGQNWDASTFFLLGGLVLIALWFFRRRR